MMKNVNELRKKYNNFVYKKYEIERNKDVIKINYIYEIEGLETFNHKLEIPNNIINHDVDNDMLNTLVFHIGMVELLSYWKETASYNINIEAAYLNDSQIKFFNKLYYLGMGEYRYLNNIDQIKQADLFKININHDKEDIKNIEYKGTGNLVPIGGGKDSCVTINLLKALDNTCFAINPKSAHMSCIEESKEDSIFIKRILDKRMIEMKDEGYLNGHVPFSASVAFITYLIAYLSNKKYIVLSNEDSANEATVLGTDINHQYSKSYDFELDFYNYTKDNFKIDLNYFSFLRPISEYQIGMIFSRLNNYHKIFKSCNVGSLQEGWPWCCNCPKCLFVFSLLSPHLYKEKLIDIFGEDLFEKKELLNTFIELLGYSDKKPFECVGTYSEVRYAISKIITKLDKLPYLLQYYKDHYGLELKPLENYYNEENNLPLEFNEILKKEL